MLVVRKYLKINPLLGNIVLKLLFFILLNFNVLNCFAIPIDDNYINGNNNLDNPDEIIFHSNGTSFSPVITLWEDAEVLWTWADNTTSNSLTPTKDYGTAELRTNRLKVTPWSAVRRINIGYDAGDDGSLEIELVDDQKVSLVENMFLVAPYLKEWCSSYNKLTQLDFSNFTELETIECYFSAFLENVNLENTNNLKRVTFEFDNLSNINISDSPLLQDLRLARNVLTEIELPNQTDSLWHLCIHHNQFSDQHFLNDISRFPNIADLLIDYTNQKGELIIPKTNPNRNVEVRANGNEYFKIDFRGAFKNTGSWGIVDMHHNEINEVKIDGCVQIKVLDLSYNSLESSEVDEVLRQMDSFGTYTGNGSIDLRNNQPPTYAGTVYKSNLEERGWTVNTDQNIPINSIEVLSNNGTTISTDDGTLQLLAEILPAEATTKTVNWSVVNETGQAKINSFGLLTAEKDGIVRAVATASDGSGITGEVVITITNQIIPLESIVLSGGNTIDVNKGTLQLLVDFVPVDATFNTVVWSVLNETGKASINSSGLLSAEKDGTVKAVATATDGSGITDELQITISNQIIPVESISISGGTTIKTDNGSLQLLIDILPTDATTKTVSWSVVNETGRASINSSGMLTAEKDGTIKVIATATDGTGITDELRVTISNQIIPVESISISGGTVINIDNGTLQLQVDVQPVDATIKTVNWSVFNETGQASINTSGLLTAEKDGIVRAVAATTDGTGIIEEFQITISNQIIPVESISISGGTSISSDNGTLQLQANVLPVDASSKTVIWSIINETGQASITSSGLLTAEKEGTVIAIATATDETGIKGELQITISNQIIPVESITISGSNVINTDKGTLQLTAVVLPADATSNSVDWSVNNETGQASITSSGILTAEKNGTVTIVATATDGTDIFGELQISISNQEVLVENIEIISNLTGDSIIGIGIQVEFGVSILPDNATNTDVSWSIENITGEAVIDSSGLITTLLPGLIRIIATAKDNSKYTCAKEFTVAIPLDIDVNKGQFDVKIFPNPTFGKIQIQINQISNKGAYIEVRNLNGQLLIKKKIFENLSLLSLAKFRGKEFFVVIVNNDNVTIRKIIKN